MTDLSANTLMDQTTTLAMDRIPRMPKQGGAEAVKKAAVDFEAVFAAQMLKPMFDAMPTDGMFGGGHAEGIYRSLMVQEYGKLIAERGGFGLADTVSAELLKAQEAQDPQANGAQSASPQIGKEVH